MLSVRSAGVAVFDTDFLLFPTKGYATATMPEGHCRLTLKFIANTEHLKADQVTSLRFGMDADLCEKLGNSLLLLAKLARERAESDGGQDEVQNQDGA